MQPWEIEFAPHSSRELIVHHSKVKEVQGWLEKCFYKSVLGKKVLFLGGNNGCGKSTCVEILCKELGIAVIRFTEDIDTTKLYAGENDKNDYEAKSDISDRLSSLKFPALDLSIKSSNNKIKSSSTYSSNSILLIEDSPEYLCEQFGRFELIDSNSFKKFISLDYSKFYEHLFIRSQFPVIFIDSTVKGTEDIASSSFFRSLPRNMKERVDITTVYFPPITSLKIKGRLSSILKTLKLSIASEIIESVVESSQGDLRKAIINLEFLQRTMPLAIHPKSSRNGLLMRHASRGYDSISSSMNGKDPTAKAYFEENIMEDDFIDDDFVTMSYNSQKVINRNTSKGPVFLRSGSLVSSLSISKGSAVNGKIASRKKRKFVVEDDEEEDPNNVCSDHCGTDGEVSQSNSATSDSIIGSKEIYPVNVVDDEKSVESTTKKIVNDCNSCEIIAILDDDIIEDDTSMSIFVDSNSKDSDKKAVLASKLDIIDISSDDDDDDDEDNDGGDNNKNNKNKKKNNNSNNQDDIDVKNPTDLERASQYAEVPDHMDPSKHPDRIVEESSSRVVITRMSSFGCVGPRSIHRMDVLQEFERSCIESRQQFHQDESSLTHFYETDHFYSNIHSLAKILNAKLDVNGLSGFDPEFYLEHIDLSLSDILHYIQWNSIGNFQHLMGFVDTPCSSSSTSFNDIDEIAKMEAYFSDIDILLQCQYDPIAHIDRSKIGFGINGHHTSSIGFPNDHARALLSRVVMVHRGGCGFLERYQEAKKTHRYIILPVYRPKYLYYWRTVKNHLQQVLHLSWDLWWSAQDYPQPWSNEKGIVCELLPYLARIVACKSFEITNRTNEKQDATSQDTSRHSLTTKEWRDLLLRLYSSFPQLIREWKPF